MKVTKNKSVVPVYVVGIIWLIYAFLFPLYRSKDFLIVSLLSLALYLLVSFGRNLVLAKKGYQIIGTKDVYVDELLLSAFEELEKLRLLRNSIWNDEVRKQISSMERDARLLLEYVIKYPDKGYKATQFFQYYLPVSTKLINNYRELEQHGRVGKNHTLGMNKIESFLNELVTAYHKVLDDLYEDKVMEASIDIEVMKKMLRQDNYLD